MCSAQRSQIQFKDEDHAFYMSFRWVTTTCLRWEPQPVTLWLYPVIMGMSFLLSTVTCDIPKTFVRKGVGLHSPYNTRSETQLSSTTLSTVLPVFRWILVLVWKSERFCSPVFPVTNLTLFYRMRNAIKGFSIQC